MFLPPPHMHSCVDLQYKKEVKQAQNDEMTMSCAQTVWQLDCSYTFIK